MLKLENICYEADGKEILKDINLELEKGMTVVTGTNGSGKHIKELQLPVIKNGKRVIQLPTLTDIREYVRKQLTEEVWEEEQRFENPHKHYLDMSPKYYEMKMNLLHEVKNQQKG